MFPAPMPENLERLFSKDIDFTHVWSGDFFDAYPQFQVQPAGKPPYLEVHGMRLGFAQIGVTFDPEEAYEKAFFFKTGSGTQFAVIDPVRLYREKQAMIEKGRSKPNDGFHRQIASTYVRFALATAERRMKEQPTTSNEAKWNHILEDIRDLAPELLAAER